MSVRSSTRARMQRPAHRAKGSGVETVLYSQYDNAGANSSNSQDFESGFATFTDELADDFVVPGGQTWSVQTVDAQGVYFNGSGPALSFNVRFYNDSSGMPGSLVQSLLGQPFTVASNDFTINLTSPVSLPAGHYWMSVQARMDFGVGGEWGWTDRTVTGNDAAMWQNPGGGFGVCPTWTLKTTCIPTASGPDQVFSLSGTTGSTAPPDYSISAGTGSIVPGTTFVTGSDCDDCIETIATPFPVNVFGSSYSSINASSNGNLQFTTSNTAFTNCCLPGSAMGVMIAPFWDDLYSVNAGMGIYTITTGSAPNRTFYVEYRSQFFPGSGSANFEVAFDEATGRISLIYGSITSDTSATVGLQASGTGPKREFSCNTAGNVPSGRQVDYTPTADYATDIQRGQAIIPGVDDSGNHCDDCATAISLPFPITVYGTPYSSANVDSNGTLQFTTSASQFTNGGLPARAATVRCSRTGTTSTRSTRAPASTRPRPGPRRTASS